MLKLHREGLHEGIADLFSFIKMRSDMENLANEACETRSEKLTRSRRKGFLREIKKNLATSTSKLIDMTKDVHPELRQRLL